MFAWQHTQRLACTLDDASLHSYATKRRYMPASPLQYGFLLCPTCATTAGCKPGRAGAKCLQCGENSWAAGWAASNNKNLQCRPCTEGTEAPAGSTSKAACQAGALVCGLYGACAALQHALLQVVLRYVMLSAVMYQRLRGCDEASNAHHCCLQKCLVCVNSSYSLRVTVVTAWHSPGACSCKCVTKGQAEQLLCCCCYLLRSCCCCCQ